MELFTDELLAMLQFPALVSLGLGAGVNPGQSSHSPCTHAMSPPCAWIRAARPTAALLLLRRCRRR
jgi:hypothetical protein